MTPQPDKLFQDKLENFQLKLPDDAWSKVESGLTRPSKSRWWMIAAGIGVTIAASFFIWKNNPDEKQKLVTQDQTEKINIPAIEKSSLAERTENADTLNQLNKISGTKETKPVLEKNKQQPIVTNLNFPKDENVEVKDENAVVVQITGPASTSIIEDKPVILTADVIEKTNSTPSSISLVYSAKDSEKYLRKSRIQKDSTTDKKLTTVELLLTVADNVKNGEKGLGDLRQIKDDLLTFSFHDDKRNKN